MRSVRSQMGEQPEVYNHNFICSYMSLNSLEGCPIYIGGDFVCDENKLETLKGGPQEVGGNFRCVHNRLHSLEGSPTYIDGNFNCSDNRLHSLKNIHNCIHTINGTFDCSNNPIESHILGLFLINGVKRVFNELWWRHIVNKHISKGKKGMLACQKELIENGFKEYAQL